MARPKKTKPLPPSLGAIEAAFSPKSVVRLLHDVGARKAGEMFVVDKAIEVAEKLWVRLFVAEGPETWVVEPQQIIAAHLPVSPPVEEKPFTLPWDGPAPETVPAQSLSIPDPHDAPLPSLGKYDRMLAAKVAAVVLDVMLEAPMADVERVWELAGQILRDLLRVML